MEHIIAVLLTVSGILGLCMTLWGGYYLFTGLMSWRRPMNYGKHPSTTRFAVLIAARNEENVIGQLIESLKQQNYPQELYDIWVIPNNCTDKTDEAARSAGANILECTIPVKSKGEVMRFAYDQLSNVSYDAFCVFDADNLVDPGFLQEMNNAYRCGARAAQGYRDSKNPHDSAISGCYSIYYWMMNRFHNGGKSGLGLSAMINGTGFMVAASTFQTLGGWRTETISEDLEMTAQCAMAGVKIHWVPMAKTYDEQPLTYSESVKQRKRWSSGTLQVAENYLPKVKDRLGQRPGLPMADMGMTMLIPAYQMVALLSLAISVLMAGMNGDKLGFAFTACAATLFVNLLLTILGSTLAAGLVLTVEEKWSPRMIKALLLYWLFLLTWLPITVESFFRKTTVWEEIRHTRTVSPGMVFAKK